MRKSAPIEVVVHYPKPPVPTYGKYLSHSKWSEVHLLLSGYDESQMVSRHASQFPYRPRCLSLHCLLQPKGVHIVAETSRTPSSLFLSLSALNPFKKESDIFSRPELCLLLFLLSCKRKKKDTDSHQHLPVIVIYALLLCSEHRHLLRSTTSPGSQIHMFICGPCVISAS